MENQKPAAAENSNHYENHLRAEHHACPRCEGRGETNPVKGRTLPCTQCFGTGEDLKGTLARWEADLVDLRLEWQHYNKLVTAARGGKRIGLSKKLDALTKRGKAHLEMVEALRAEVKAHTNVAPF